MARRVHSALGGDPGAAEAESTAHAVAGLAGRASATEAALRRTDEQLLNITVYSTERTDAVIARLAAAEDRLASMETEAAGLREALRRLGEAALGEAPEADTVAYWRWRLGEPSPPPHRHGPVTRVATDVGALLFPAQDEVMLSFLRQHGEWEREEADQLRALLRPGMTFVDVGAHVGYMSLVAGAAVGPSGRGFAFEPEPLNFLLLQANLAEHGAGNVEAVPAAAWRESGRLSLSLCIDNTGDHRVYPVAGREGVDVLALALDDVVPDAVKVDVVKVDAQATDDLAIRGMERTLSRSRPVLLVEFWPEGIAQRGGVPLDVLEYYRDLRYNVSVLGHAHAVPPAPLEAVLEVARSSPTEFCTLLLTPSE